MTPPGAPRPETAVVVMEDVRRRFGAAVALDGARLSLAAGEVHAVLGANGAGKTTLLSILAGLLRPDAGRIVLRGRTVALSSPRDAWAAGIGMVHQHFMLVPRMSALENLALGRRGVRLGLGGLRARAEALAAGTGLEVRLDRAVEHMGVGERQRVEILKVLLRRPDVLVLDEPTAVLAPVEVERLLDLLRALAAGGTTVVLVAHKLDEVLSVADRVTVLREGRTVLEAPRAEVEPETLVRAMVGAAGSEEAAQVETVGAVEPAGVAPRTRAGDVVARLAAVSLVVAGGRALLADVSLEVRRGEIVGVAGVEGNGQRELARLLAGRLAATSGTVELPPDPAYIPQDRTSEGLVGSFTLTENVALALHREPAFRRGPWIRWDRLRARTAELMHAFQVRPPSPDAPLHGLSGGNQQRVVVARELGKGPALLVADNPTRGLDVRAAAFVHARLGALEATATVLVSADLDEVLRLSDRVFVMVRGRLVAVPEAERTRDGVGRMMLAGAESRG